MSATLGELENLIGYRFTDPGLLERAVTHRSWAYERSGQGEKAAQNETLEFVGDSVLGLAIAEQIFLNNKESSEGEMTLMKHNLVSADTLAEVSRELGLGQFLRLGKGEERSGGRERRTILSNAFEALIGAVFFDGGYIQARSVVKRMFGERIRNVTPGASLDFKTLLQETLQAQRRAAPVYNVIKTEGPSHNRRFTVEAVWDAGRSVGKGGAIKSAEMEAARQALEMLNSDAVRTS